MNNVVVDTSIAVKWFFPEKGQDQAISLKNNYLKGEITIFARDLILYEFTSAFKDYSHTKIEEKDFFLAVSALMSLQIRLIPLRYQELTELFQISRTLSLSVYDSSFLLLAKQLNATLYTADKKLFQNGKKTVKAVFI